MPSLPNCPHCGKAAPVWVHINVDDVYVAKFDEDGLQTSVAGNPILGNRIYRCAACMGRRADLVLKIEDEGTDDEIWHLDARREVSDGK
jgi:hypothetical protein